MNTANIPGSHLNPQQIQLFTASPQTRKRWIWSQHEDHLQLLSARAASDAVSGKSVIIFYDEGSAAEELLRQFPLHLMENSIYCPGLESNTNALHKQNPDQGIHHIELYKLTGDYDRILKAWSSLHEELWPGTNRYDLISKFAGLFNHSSFNPLFYRLSRTMFEISPAEYKRLRNKIEHHIKLNKLRQDGFEHLDLLDVSLLVNHSLDFVKSEVMQYVSLAADQANELLKRAEWTMLRYYNYVRAYWVREINSYVSKIDNLLSHAQELQLTFGPAFSFESSMSHFADQLKGRISRKAKMISQQRKAVKTQYLELLDEIESGQQWVQVPAEWKEHIALTDAITNLRELRTSLLNAKDPIETHIRSQLKRLNSHNAPEHTGLGKELKEWEEDLLKWYNDVNVSGYFKKRFESQALSVHRSAENLKEIHLALSAIIERQHHLEDYFFWAGFQNQFPDAARSIVQALHLVPSKDWLMYFDEWYITQLVTGNSLEVEWPQMPGEDLKLLIELLRHHMLAEFQHDIINRRAILCDEQAAEIRKLILKKGTIDRIEAEQFLFEMTADERAKWFPIQLLPISSSASGFDNASVYILLKSKEPALELHWSKVQELGCDIYAYVPPVNQRFLDEKLHMPQMLTDFRIGQNRSSSSLKYLSNLAKQFSPFLSKACIYSAHRVNVISMLGAELDRLVLDQLPMPYKISERSLHPDEDFLVETLLEPNKPFVFLVRDFWPTGAWPENSNWCLQFLQDVEKVGIRVVHSWSKGWLMEPDAEVKRVRDEILKFVGTSVTGIQV